MWNDLKELYANERRYDEAGLTSEERLRERQGLMTKEFSETMLYIMEAMVERKWQPCMIV